MKKQEIKNTEEKAVGVKIIRSRVRDAKTSVTKMQCAYRCIRSEPRFGNTICIYELEKYSDIMSKNKKTMGILSGLLKNLINSITQIGEGVEGWVLDSVNIGKGKSVHKRRRKSRGRSDRGRSHRCHIEITAKKTTGVMTNE